MRFLFACGGTAGHINPAIGVAGRIRELLPDSEILFIGAEGKMELELVPREGYEIRAIPVSSISRSIGIFSTTSTALRAFLNVITPLKDKYRPSFKSSFAVSQLPEKQ